MTIVYEKKILTRGDLAAFYVKRIFRIFPVFYLATTLTILFKLGLQFSDGEKLGVSSYTTILNYTLTFGFIEPRKYFATGAWSIGNEMVFYAILPVLFFLNSKFKFTLVISFIASLLVGLFFAFFLLSAENTLAQQWPKYINPFNQTFLFLGGVIIGKYARLIPLYRTPLLLATLAALLVFVFLPESGDKIGIVTGKNRVLMSLSSLVIVLYVYLANPLLKGLAAKLLQRIGEACYSIYLLHPLISIPILYVGSLFNFPEIYSYLLSAPLTILLGWWCYKLIEEPMIHYGKRLASRLHYKE